MMSPQQTPYYDIIINSVTEPVALPDMLPSIIKKRLSQALRVNRRDDWEQFAQLCYMTALRFFEASHFDQQNADFKACCQLARNAYLRGAECLTPGGSMPRQARRRSLR